MKTHHYLKSRPPFLSSGPNPNANRKPESNAVRKGLRARMAAALARLFDTNKAKQRETERLDAERVARRRRVARETERAAQFRERLRRGLELTQAKDKKELELRQQRELRKRERESRHFELERRLLRERWERQWEEEATHGTNRIDHEQEFQFRLLQKAKEGFSRSEIDGMMKTWKEDRLKRYRQIWAEMANRDKEHTKAAVRALFAAANRKGEKGGDNPMSRALAIATSRVRTARFTVARIRIVVPNNMVLRMWVGDWCKFQRHRPGPRHISNWDTSNVTDMSGLFQDQKAFDDDISGWDTSNVTDMSQMFMNATKFNKNIGGWDTSQVTHMNQMFYYASAFNQNLDTKKVTKNGRTYMAWDTRKLVYWSAMFIGASAFNKKRPVGYGVPNKRRRSGY